jgi:AraC-like DNA-binding protein
MAKTCAAVRWKSGQWQDPSWNRFTLDHDIWIITEGEGELLTSEGWRSVHPGMAAWMTPNFFYDARQNPERPLGMIYIHFDLLEDGALRPYDAPRPREIIALQHSELVLALARRMTLLLNWAPVNEQTPPATVLHANALLRSLLIELEMSAGSVHVPQRSGIEQFHANKVIQCARLLYERPNDPPTVVEMAEQCGYSPEHFGRIFRKMTGQSPKQYLIRRRMNVAAMMLIRTDKSVGEIAAELGYDDQFYFTRQFTAYQRRTPTEFRKLFARLPPI